MADRIYVSIQDDWWDLISLRVYGGKRGDERLMHKLIEANYPIREISNFPAGIPVIVPPVPVKTEIPLVPWKKASVISIEF
jgi:tail protein X